MVTSTLWYINPGYLKCISGINLSPAYKNLFTISLVLYLVLTCFILLTQKRTYRTNFTILLKDVFIPKLFNNPLVFCSFINFEFLLSHTAHFDKSIILPFFVFATFEFLLYVFFLHFKE